MSTRFIILLSILMLFPFFGMMQTHIPSFTQGERSIQLTYEADTNQLRIMIDEAMDLINDMPDSSLALLTRVLQESQRSGNEYGMGISWLGIGHVYMKKAMYQASIDAYKQALLYSYREPRLENRRAGIYNNMAVQYMYLGDLYQSMSCLTRAVLYIERGKSRMSMSMIYNNIPIILGYVAPSDSQNHAQSKHYLDLAEATARRENNTESLGSALISKGIYYGRQKQWELSYNAFKEALTLARRHQMVNTEVSALNNLGTLYLQYLHIDSARQAITYLNEALALRDRVYRHHYLKTLHVLGQSYYSMGEYKKAEPLLLQALEGAEAASYYTELPNICNSLSELYIKTRNYQKALEYYQRHVAIKDSITGKEVANNIHLLETRYRTAQKDKEIIRKEFQIAVQENRLKEKNIWIISITAGSLLLITLLLSTYRSNRQKQRLQTEKIRNLQQEQEIVRLKSIMDGAEKERARIARELHDGIVGQLSATKLSFGAIQNAHTDLKQIPDFNDALKQLDEATQDLRKTAHNLMPEILLQAGLVEAIQIYCNKMSKGAPPVVRFHSSGVLPAMNQDFELTLYRIAQELIQNAVKHAHAQEVFVQLDYQDQLIGLTVEDNGCGFEWENIPDDNGMGLKNMQARIKALNGTLSVTSRAGEGTSIYLEFDTDNVPG